jgi:catechol 2,3-dioxygenase-like lactoylglutathione lyase family enzyme
MRLTKGVVGDRIDCRVLKRAAASARSGAGNGGDLLRDRFPLRGCEFHLTEGLPAPQSRKPAGSDKAGRGRWLAGPTDAGWGGRAVPRLGAVRPGAVNLNVGDLDRQRAFYEQTIGLRELDATEGAVRLGADGAPVVELVAAPSAPRRPPRTTGLFHLAVLVPSRRELAGSIRRVVRSGWSLTGASDHLVSEALYLNDPEGNGIEIYRDRPRGPLPERPGGERDRDLPRSPA